jgi:ankyrin repeat protein
MLLEVEKTDINLKNHSRMLLSWAAENGHGVMVKMLLNNGKVDIDFKENDG